MICSTIRLFPFIILFLIFEYGHAQEVRLVKDINPDGNSLFSGSFNDFADVGGNLFFVANDGTHGSELWISDGTSEGTKMVKDIVPGNSNSEIHGLIEHNGLCYFFADEGVFGKELWSSDGTESGTQRITDINPGSGSATFSTFEYLTSYDGSIYFEAYNGDSDELWVIDSNNNASLFPGLPDEVFHSGITGITVMDGDLYFFRKITFDGLVLYKYDGIQLTKIDELGLGNIITEFSHSNGILYYAVQEGFNDILYSYNSTSNTNTRLYDASSSIYSMIAFQSRLLFSVNNDASLYVIDESSSSPTLLAETSWIFADEPSLFTIFDDKVYYYGETSDDGIHSTDGTSNGTELLFEFEANAIHPIGDKLLLSGEVTYVSGEELFQTDGSALELVGDLNPGNRDSDPRAFTKVGEDKVYFAATTEENGRELWVYELESVATEEIKTSYYDVYPTIFSDWINIKNNSEDVSETVNLVVYNAQGIKIKEGTIKSSAELETAKWRSGVYYINLTLKDKSETIVVTKM